MAGSPLNKPASPRRARRVVPRWLCSLTSIRAGQNGRCKSPAAWVGRPAEVLGGQVRWSSLCGAMATTPTITDAGALAVKPARVNIFAKPSAPQDQTDPAARQPRGIFDDAAACHSTDEVTDRRAAPSAHGGGRLGGAGALRRQRLPHCPGSGRCEPDRRHLVAPGEPRRGRGTGATGPSPAATTARFPRGEPAILSAARRQATQAAHTAQSRSRARPARPAASGGCRGQPRRRARRALAPPRPGSARRGARPTAPDPRGARRPARVHVNGGSDGP